MSVRKRVIFGALTLAVFAVATLAIAALQYLPRINDGARHTFVLAGSDPLTDRQAVDFSRQTLVADGRLGDGMELEPVTDSTAVNRGDDKSICSVSWWYPRTPKRFYVQLHRTPGQVETVSYPGK